MSKWDYWWLFFSLGLAGAIVVLLAAEAFAEEGQGSPAKICGDVNGDAAITASDALRVLIKSVGIDVEMRCNNRCSMVCRMFYGSVPARSAIY